MFLRIMWTLMDSDMMGNLLTGFQPNTKPVYIIAATNCPWDIDPAMLRRLPIKELVPLPEGRLKFEIWLYF